MESLFINRPISIIDEIPIFSSEDEYILNYQSIAEKQLLEIQKSGNNPWIENTIWSEMEKSTSLLMKKYSQPGDSVLDVGVGLGRLLKDFDYLDRYGIDIDLNLLRIASQNGIKCSFSRVEDMPYKEHSFDMVVCTDVLEHVLDLNYCCKRILSVVKPNGFLIIRAPYKEDLQGYLSPDYPFTYAHLRSFDESEMALLFTRIIKNCDLIESNFTGYWNYNSRLRYPISFPGRDTLLKILWRLNNQKRAGFYFKLIERLYLPIEFNIVFRKKSE